MAYVRETETETVALRALVERVGLGRVVEMLRHIELERAGRDTEMGAKGMRRNAELLSDVEEKLVYAWVEEDETGAR